LHPEDQPYQSNKIVTPQRAVRDAQDNTSLPQEPEHIVLPPTQHAPMTRVYRDFSQAPTRRPIPARRSRRPFASGEPLSAHQDQETQDRAIHRQQMPRPFVQEMLEETSYSPLSEELYPTDHNEIDSQATIQGADYELAQPFSFANDITLRVEELPTYMRDALRTRSRSSRILSTVFIGAGFFFLLATSVIVLMLMGNHQAVLHAQLKINPQSLGPHDTFSLEGNGFTPDHKVTFTLDTTTIIQGANGQALQANTDAKGSFSLHSSVPSTWSVGSHVIYAIDQASMQRFSAHIIVQAILPTPPHLHLSVSQDNFGSSASGVVSSQTITLENSGGGTVAWQASSDQAWLTTSPNSGVFVQSENIQIDVNRGGMVPGDYTGHIIFRQQGQANISSALNVAMTVAPAPAQMSVSVTALSYSTAQSQVPEDQVLIIGNIGEQALNWDATLSTEDGTPWLTLSLYHGVLPAGYKQALTVHVKSQSLPVGTYSGLILFTGNADAHVVVSLTVVTPGTLVISPPSLSANASSNATHPTNQTLALQNSGDWPLAWTVVSSTADGRSWLSVTPASGTLAPGGSATIAVSADPAKLAPGSYQGTLTFSSGEQTQQISISFVVSGATTTPVPTATTTPTATVLPTEGGSVPIVPTSVATRTDVSIGNVFQHGDSGLVSWLFGSSSG
jgi:hypothetical protein